MQTKKLIHNNQIILPNMKYATTTYELSKGLMFKGKKEVEKGMCLVMPNQDVRYGASITMLFCFVHMEIIFINSNFIVVDKKRLKTWTPSYTPKEKCKYIIESTFGKFKNIKIGDKIEIK